MKLEAIALGWSDDQVKNKPADDGLGVGYEGNTRQDKKKMGPTS